jgi:hypothetical protein
MESVEAFELPQIGCFTLYQFPCVLKHPKDYPTWRTEINQVPRDPVADLDGHLLPSPSIGRVLVRAGDARVNEPMEIVKGQPRAELADEFMMGTETILQRFARSPAEDYDSW